MLDYLRNLRKSNEEKQQEALHAYLDDALTPQQRQQVDKALAADADLQAELNQMRLLQQQMRQLPRRQVPRNFTLNPALYGRPRREPLIQAYPVLRMATVLTALIFIFAFAANVFLSGTTNQAIESAEPLAMMVEPAAEMAVEETVVSEAELTMEMDGQPEMAEEAIEEEAASEMEFDLADEKAIAEEQILPAEAMEAPAFSGDEAELQPQATMGADDQEQKAFPAGVESTETDASAVPPLATPELMPTEIAQQLVPQDAPIPLTRDETDQVAREAEATDGVTSQPSYSFNLILLLLGVVLVVLLVLTLTTRRRLQ